jgi:polysaccharide pyruvyl transferase WcaK-like protein
MIYFCLVFSLMYIATRRHVYLTDFHIRFQPFDFIMLIRYHSKFRAYLHLTLFIIAYSTKTNFLAQSTSLSKFVI